jgi:hypothetical protein
MLRCVEVRAGMTVLRRVAAADVTAFKAHTQMHPAIAALQAFFAAFAARFYLLYVIFYMRAG